MQTLLLFWLVANLCIFATWVAVWTREILESGTKRSPTNAIRDDREDIEALLPWYAAGTLELRDAERVAKAIAGDRKLARHFDLVREEFNETILLNEMLGAPSARAAEKLFAAIDAEPSRKPQTSFDLARRLVTFVSRFSMRTLAWASSAAVLVIALQVGVIVTMLVKNEAGQGPELASMGGTNASHAIIRFSGKANASDITTFLQVNKVSVIEGPNSGGMYAVRLPVIGQEKNELIKQIQAQSGIVEFIATVQ
jgi:hypothetical protein